MTDKMVIEQAFILAAGRGERMRPLTDNTPKPLVKVSDKTMLDMALAKLNKLPQIKKIVINAYYLADQIAAHIQSLNNSKITLSLETSKLETGGGLLQALNLFDKTKPILVINSDIIWHDEQENISDLELLINNFDASAMDILLGIKNKNQFWGYEGKGDFCFDPKTKNLSKPEDISKLNYAFIGLQIIHPRIFENSPTPPFSMNYFYKNSIGKDQILNKIKGQELQGKFFHIGTAPAIKDYEKLGLN